VTDPDLVEKKLAAVETCVMDLRRLAVARPTGPTSSDVPRTDAFYPVVRMAPFGSWELEVGS